MLKRTLILVILVVAGIAAEFRADAQAPPRSEVALTYDWTRSNAPPNGCGCFSLNGGSGSFAFRFSEDFSVVGAIGAGTAGNVNGSGQELTITDFLAGARFEPHPLSRVQPFGELLFGAAHASGSLSPNQLGIGSSSAFALQPGGGIDVKITRRIAVRAVDASYLLTTFPNRGNNLQNSFQVGTGIVLKF
jgi:outer membrane immunogenic protein